MQDAFWNNNFQQDHTGNLTSLIDDLNHLLHQNTATHHVLGQSDSLTSLHQLIHEIQVITGIPQVNVISNQTVDLNQLLQNLTHCLDLSGMPHTSGMSDLHQAIAHLKASITPDVLSDAHTSLSNPTVNTDLTGTGRSLHPASNGLGIVSEEFQLKVSLELDAVWKNNNLTLSPVGLEAKGSFDLHTRSASYSFQDLDDQNSLQNIVASLTRTTIATTLHSPHTAQVMQSCDGAIDPDSDNSIRILGNGAVFWRRGGQICWVDGHEFWNSAGHFGRLGSNLKVFDKNDNYIGYVTPNGCAYTPDGRLFARGGTAIWAAGVLLCNTR